MGAQNPKYVQRPTVDKIRHFQEVAKGLIKIITFAPEVEGAHDTLNELRDEIIFQWDILSPHLKKQMKR